MATTNKARLYTALLTGQLRKQINGDTHILLKDITPNHKGLIRDHCWVAITPELDKLRPKGHSGKTISITMKAKLKKYLKRGTEEAYTLKDIKLAS